MAARELGYKAREVTYFINSQVFFIYTGGDSSSAPILQMR